MSDVKCTICEADFRPDAIVYTPAGVPKCPICAKAHPKALTKEEVQITSPDKAQTLSEPRVREVVYEILEEANLIRHKCESCNALFFRNKPMQKKCNKCDAKKEVN